mmetsp:Transcript_45801/g.107033  ORF Transcript_45801/g.107033 Transcript_45801/m.107033 type:complete len:135 (+) Transcript_45801:177-581(+)
MELSRSGDRLGLQQVRFFHAGLLPEMLAHRSLHEVSTAVRTLLEGVASSAQGRQEILGPRGPLWTGDFALGGKATCQMAMRVLPMEEDRMVVGHTIQTDFRVHTRCGGRNRLADADTFATLNPPCIMGSRIHEC